MMRASWCRGRVTGTVVALCLGMPTAWAGCRTTMEDGNVPDEIELDLGAITVPPTLAVGRLIKAYDFPFYGTLGSTFEGRCDLPGGSQRMFYVHAKQQVPVPGMDHVYPTDVAGIGIRISGVVILTKRTFPWEGQITVRENNTGYYVTRERMRVELIRTAAAIGSGRIAPLGTFALWNLDQDPISTYLLRLYFREPSTVVNATCSVQAGSGNIAVDFGAVPSARFTGPGTRADNRDFNIQLACSGADLRRVGIRLDATADDSALPGVMKLSEAADSAKGIGIEVVRREGTAERALQFGETINLGSTVTNGSAVLTLPLRARYLQTVAGKVGAGSANGVATFTIQYN